MRVQHEVTMPKRRLVKNALAGISLVAMGAGLSAGWNSLGGYPGVSRQVAESAASVWTRLTSRSATTESTPVATIPRDAPRETRERAVQASVAPAAPAKPETATPIDTPVGKIATRADTPATALAAIGSVAGQTESAPPAADALPGQAYAPLPDLAGRQNSQPESPQDPQKDLAKIEAEKPKLPLPVDATGVREALAAYKAGDLAKGDAAAKTATNPVARATLEWAALRLQSRSLGLARIEAFLQSNADWPVAEWVRARAEQAMFVESAPAAKLSRWFDTAKPASATGSILLARRLIAQDKTADAAAMISKLWREDDLGAWAEGAILKEFGALLKAEDHRWRADRFFYKEKYALSTAAAARAGKDFLAFANARIAVAKGADPAKAKIDAKWSKDPTWRFAQVHRLRKAEKYEDAAKLLTDTNTDPATLVDVDEWWEERRIVARKRLDAGDAETAYKVAAPHGASAGEALIAAEFHAGWIALRFLNKPDVALEHFARAGEAATTPMSRSRAFYWQARAAEKSEEPEAADRLYALAARYSSNYYGQLALERLGRKDVPIRTAPHIAQGDERMMAVRVVELLEALGETDLSLPLAVGMGRTVVDTSQLAALGDVLARSKHARATLVVGKLAAQRGVELDDIAFPAYGVPDFSPLVNSAAKPVVYAIARQESAFQSNVVSHAGAKGLMQMLTSTAQRTAKNKNVAFDANRLLSDPSFNAQLGAAHLGELMEEHPGSLLMVFAAYNAGGHRVKQWIAAYGDPRKPGVDPIDWVERIPFTETRNYVQRVAENLAMYRQLLKEHSLPRVAETELRAYAARM